MRIIIFILLVIAARTSLGQSPAFIAQWDTIQMNIKSFDSTINYVSTKRMAFRRNIAKLKIYSNDALIMKKSKTRYRNGTAICREYYRVRKGDYYKLKILKLDGEIVMIQTYIKSPDFGKIASNVFVNKGDGTWEWINKRVKPSGIKTHVEVAQNWP